ncbi:uncharacterized protein LOC143586546 [Bidens hawaiensis]|uniref:uncharacterized protein LOC143586546 n=1 Tax=Bidens hawaiensis TaxID=980011 RepID=UPI00404B4DE1
MTWMLIRRVITRYQFQPIKHTLPFTTLHPSISKIGVQSTNNNNNNSKFKVDIIDNDTWQVSTGLSSINQLPFHNNKEVNNLNHENPNSDDLGFDDIDDLRICGKLFYKLDKDSKEYEEYNYNFHKNKSSKCKSKDTKPTENEDKAGEVEPKPKRTHGNVERKSDERFFIEKKKRVLTFNQVTGPYHEPFCLDVYVSKASVRACIVHRATSNVVAVAHSISKDMKFDLGSTKSHAACAAVGKVLAQRALADDIHNVVYTPRKGEKLEGKLLNVVQSVMNNGVMVKIKLKKKKVPKHGFQPANYQPN